MKVAEAKVVATLSRLTACEMELEILWSKLSEKEAEVQKVAEASNDATFEEVEAIYLEQVEKMNTLVFCFLFSFFKREYDVGLSDVGVPEDSPLWINYATQSDCASPTPTPSEVPTQCQAGEVCSPMVGDEGTSTPTEPTHPAPSVP